LAQRLLSRRLSLCCHATAPAVVCTLFPPRRSSDLVAVAVHPDRVVVTAHRGPDRVVHGLGDVVAAQHPLPGPHAVLAGDEPAGEDRKSTRLNSSHVKTSYAVFCLKKKTHETQRSKQ